VNKSVETNKLLEYFKVDNHKDLMELIKENKDDVKVKELKELLIIFDIDLDRAGEYND